MATKMLVQKSKLGTCSQKNHFQMAPVTPIYLDYTWYIQPLLERYPKKGIYIPIVFY